MKTFQKLLSVVLFVLISVTVNAQNQTEDVVYLKDGSIYRGVIVEQVPNVSLKVQIMGGSIVAVQMEQVSKITKEEPFSSSEYTLKPTINTEKPVREKTPFEIRKKGYFFQGQLLIEALQGGMRFVNGYKFGRFGHLGIGVGFDAFGGSVFNQPINGLNPNDMAGVYLPLYVYYAGDILTKRITPFYMVEAGYAHPIQANNGPFGGGMEDVGFGGGSSYEIDGGGAMGTLGLGVRFNTKRRVNFSLLLNVGVKNVQYSEYYYLYDEVDGIYESYGTTGLNATLITGGLRFGIGF